MQCYVLEADAAAAEAAEPAEATADQAFSPRCSCIVSTLLARYCDWSVFVYCRALAVVHCHFVPGRLNTRGGV